MENIVLNAQKRSTDTPAKVLVSQGLIPGICYGSGKENIAIQADYQDFRKVYKQAGENTIVELNVDGEKHKVLIHELQIDPLYNTARHVDFLLVNMKEKVDTSVPVVIVGEAPAVKEQGGTLNLVLQEIEVRCLPGDIPHEFNVDVTTLVDFHSAIHVSDLVVPKDVELLTEPEVTIVNVVAPSTEEESTLTPEELEKAAIEASAPKEDAA
jgi:large subunit ribosomal protein L25